MTSAIVQREPNRSGPRLKDWEPPMSAEELRHLARTLRTGVPVDDLYDIIDASVGRPDEPTMLAMTERLRGALMQLVNAVVERDGEMLAPQLADLVKQARELRVAEALPGGPHAQLRRLAIVTEGLLENLLEGMPEVSA
ncbi:DUF6415 family natural product biosynthesis protein [Streptomyces virginiae]|uniref:DUF6415 family natural product biosynthesis protein n=1 Tax=Streptomyces virginiae TaxID=1961 RepID=UPI00225B3F33|nr:DUF6415 family natural product biosynthesis protein [Streptomyces virginiae]MCX5278092.1 DUF6415 family natural product biosynthesis protein [Streptomyces virginiae]